jgi:hypothetical protein
MPTRRPIYLEDAYEKRATIRQPNDALFELGARRLTADYRECPDAQT